MLRIFSNEHRQAPWGKATTWCHWGSWHVFLDHVRFHLEYFHTIENRHRVEHLTCKQLVLCWLPFSVRSHLISLQIAIILSLQPISSKYQEARLFQDIRTAVYWTSSLKLDYWFTCVLSAELWCNFLVISQAFVCSQPLLRCVSPCFAVLCSDKRNQPMTYCACFSSVTGLEVNSFLNAASFKSSQRWLEIEIMIHWINLPLGACVCLIVDKQIQWKFINVFILS